MIYTNSERSIDVVIPTFRLQEKELLTLIYLQRPADFAVQFYVIADNPDAAIPESIRKLHEANGITLLINSKNEGVPATRNRGILAGKSKWILFLDDDIHPQEDLLLAYAEAIRQHPDAI
uniref:glycosyltransferase family 2 protein n=1 Tax=Spirosoma sp. TaxID=1899569 RepID=UPI003B3A6D52